MSRVALANKMQELLAHHAQEIDALENSNDHHCINDTVDDRDYRDLMQLLTARHDHANPPSCRSRSAARATSVSLSMKHSGNEAADAEDWERSKDEALGGIAATLLVAHTARKAPEGTPHHADTTSEGMKESLRVLAEGGVCGEAFRNMRLRILEQLRSVQGERGLS
ncbi:unnamed protein product [Phytomonas sp. EM1]|nr:unnamed protein product [Phytomonas sp. EM1]|eukprot:CCW63755.1 unnamed protein product [Phytomonas sp. isolate EM1]